MFLLLDAVSNVAEQRSVPSTCKPEPVTKHTQYLSCSIFACPQRIPFLSLKPLASYDWPIHRLDSNLSHAEQLTAFLKPAACPKNIHSSITRAEHHQIKVCWVPRQHSTPHCQQQAASPPLSEPQPSLHCYRLASERPLPQPPPPRRCVTHPASLTTSHSTSAASGEPGGS